MEISGPEIIFTLPVLGGIPITETVVNSWIVMAFLVIASIFLTRNLQKIPKGVQVLVEKGVSMLYQLVEDTMGKDKIFFAPYIGTLFLFSLCSNLCGLFGLRPPTADLNTTACWALIMFVCIQFFSVQRHGLKARVKSFFEPVPIMFPMNLMGEFSTPVSMSFRHYGNIFSGVIISTLMGGAFAGLTALVFNGLQIPILGIGIPAVLSVYFDLFTGFIQAYIISMLSMVFIANAMD